MRGEAVARSHAKLARCLTYALLLTLVGCVSRAPTLDDAQELKLSKLTLFPAGEQPAQSYKIIGPISGADCSAAPFGGRLAGKVDRAMDTLKRKAVAAGADAVVDVSCGAAPLLNNCYVAQKCSGQAVAFVKGDATQ